MRKYLTFVSGLLLLLTKSPDGGGEDGEVKLSL